MNDPIWYFGFIHFLIYAAIGLAFIVYSAFRIIGGIAKVIYHNRDAAVPRFEP